MSKVRPGVLILGCGGWRGGGGVIGPVLKHLCKISRNLACTKFLFTPTLFLRREGSCLNLVWYPSWLDGISIYMSKHVIISQNLTLHLFQALHLKFGIVWFFMQWRLAHKLWKYNNLTLSFFIQKTFDGRQSSKWTNSTVCAYLQTGTYCTHALFAAQGNLVYDMYNTTNNLRIFTLKMEHETYSKRVLFITKL